MTEISRFQSLSHILTSWTRKVKQNWPRNIFQMNDGQNCDILKFLTDQVPLQEIRPPILKWILQILGQNSHSFQSSA